MFAFAIASSNIIKYTACIASQRRENTCIINALSVLRVDITKVWDNHTAGDRNL